MDHAGLAMVDYSELFAMLEGGAKRPLRIAPYDESDVLSIGERFKRYRLGHDMPEAPVMLRPIDGETACDFLFSYALSLVVISNRVVETLRREGVTGWGTYPIEIHADHDHFRNSHQGLVVTGRCGKRTVTRSASGYRVSHTGMPYLVREGFRFDNDDWDGSDIFCPDDTSHLFVTRRVKQVLQALGASNVLFQMLETMEL